MEVIPETAKETGRCQPVEIVTIDIITEIAVCLPTVKSESPIQVPSRSKYQFAVLVQDILIVAKSAFGVI